jgi:hypothetical protein
MHKSFLDLVLESNQIEEMALQPEQFPDTYLKRAKDRQALARSLAPLVKSFQEALVDLNWRQITWVTRGSSYYPILPGEILAFYKEAKDKVQQEGGSDSFINNFMNNNFGKWADANNQSDCIHMEVDSSGRSHFPGGGIPSSLRGARLGYKLYRALLEQKKWLKSNTAGTLEKDNAWASLISPKLNADGSLSDDDVHAILGPDCVFAMIKTISDDQKIRFATSFLDNNISYSSVNTRNFGIDDELKAILPADLMARFDPAERERLERERREREQREAAERARQYGIERGIQWDEQPEIGDLVYVRQYASSRDTSIPIRIIVGERGSSVYALNVQQYLTWRDQANSDMDELGGFDTRSCLNNPESIKDYFVKVDPAQIPGLEDDSTILRSRYAQSEWERVRDFILSMVDPELAARMRAEREERERTEREERERLEAERQAQRAQNEERFGPSYEAFRDSEYKDALESRVPGGTYITKIFKRGQITDIALSPDQLERFNRRKSTPVFLPARDAYFNSMNGFKIDEPIEGLGLTRFRLERFDSKRATTPNEMLYIASHNTYYGLVAPVDYFVFNTTRNEEYIYLRVYDNTSGRARKIAIKVAALRKIVAY